MDVLFINPASDKYVYQELSKDYSAIFVASFSEMSVKEMIEFRTEIRNNDGVTKVSKNKRPN